jgi:hypothetical protein
MLTRRLFLGGLLVGTAAPAIVRASSLMPIWVPKLDTVSGLQMLMNAHRSYSEQMVKSFYNARFDEIVNRAYLDQAELACNPPLIVGELGQIERFAIISTPHLPRRSLWR